MSTLCGTKRMHAIFVQAKAPGSWEFYQKIPDSWTLSYRELTFRIQPTGFKHTGLFPEQAVNWSYFMETIQEQTKPVRVLNLFAYTGAATLACAAAGAEVCHVDASKGMVAWARENAALSGLSDRPIRWIVDDCEKFVAREIKRGRRYDAVIMDPPSYGRGPGGEVWKLEEQIYRMVDLCARRAFGQAAVLCFKLLYNRAFPVGYALSSRRNSRKAFRRRSYCR